MSTSSASANRRSSSLRLLGFGLTFVLGLVGAPDALTAGTDERVSVAFTWTVPSPETWHDLESPSLRLKDPSEQVIFWTRWTESDNRFVLQPAPSRKTPATTTASGFVRIDRASRPRSRSSSTSTPTWLAWTTTAPGATSSTSTPTLTRPPW